MGNEIKLQHFPNRPFISSPLLSLRRHLFSSLRQFNTQNDPTLYQVDGGRIFSHFPYSRYGLSHGDALSNFQILVRRR
ncbi:hypothetical protein ERO13_D08G047250v2 [Gossypium hirsutum]|nr:hypothetical protein ERO13_D08G047250v2 [Gossypium hirsutum]